MPVHPAQVEPWQVPDWWNCSRFIRELPSTPSGPLIRVFQRCAVSPVN